MSRYQLLPPLSADEYAALRDDIKSAGVRVPIDVDENGDILDGHHRKQICDELGIECPERVVRGLADFAKVDYALTVNLARRHLTSEGRSKLVKASLKRDPRLSNREHARRCGVSHPFVASLRAVLESGGQLETVTSRVGRDGRERPIQDHREPPPGDAVSVGHPLAAAGAGVQPPAPVQDHRDDTPGAPDPIPPNAGPVADGSAPSVDPGSDTPPSDPGSPNDFTEWREEFRVAIAEARGLLRFTVGDIAEKADQELIDALYRYASELDVFVGDVTIAHAMRGQ